MIPVISINIRKARELDVSIGLRELYYQPSGYQRTAKSLSTLQSFICQKSPNLNRSGGFHRLPSAVFMVNGLPERFMHRRDPRHSRYRMCID